MRAVGRDRCDLSGRHVFEAFPGDPAQPDAVQALEASLREALATGQTTRLPLLHYDVETGPGTGRLEERWWAVVNVPVLDGEGAVVGLVNAVQDMTEVMREQERSRLATQQTEQLRTRGDLLQTDLLVRSRELAAVARAEALASRRLMGLAEAALALATADTLEELVEVVVGRGLVALGADGGAVAVRDDDSGAVDLTLTASLGPAAQRVYARLPLDGPLPASVAARTGCPVLLPDRAAGLAFAPEMAAVYATTGKTAWAALPLQIGGRLLGSVVASWDGPQEFGSTEVDLIAAFAAQCAQGLDRLLVRQAERDSAAASRRLSEALQHSLLTDPPQPDHLQIAVRYLPAAEEAQVGGDWYDAFLVGGTTTLVVGDVAGHDRNAAAAMAQVRNVLRGVAHAHGKPPATVLLGLDRALADLGVGALATAVLAQVEQGAVQGWRGLRTLRWSSAGHPPPLLLQPDGTAELLTRPADLLLGLEPDTDRSDHTAVLHPGATVLLYTDGLVERRGALLDDGLEWLRSTCVRYAALPLEELCDALLADLEGQVEDDVAVLALRAYPEDGPRPSAAGPERLPGDEPDHVAV